MKKIATFRKNSKEVIIPCAVRIEKQEKIIIIDVTKIEGKATSMEINIKNCNSSYSCELLVAYKDATGKIMKKSNPSNFPLYIPVGNLNGMFPCRETLPRCINLFTVEPIEVIIN